MIGKNDSLTVSIEFNFNLLENVFELLAEYIILTFEHKLVKYLISAHFIIHERLHIVVVNFSLDKSRKVYFLALNFVANLLSELC